MRHQTPTMLVLKGKVKVPREEFEDEPARPSDDGLKDVALSGDVYEALQDLHIRGVAKKIVDILKEIKEADKVHCALLKPKLTRDHLATRELADRG